MKGLEFIRRHTQNSLEDIGKVVGVSKQAVLNWEKGRRKISLEYQQQLSDFFKIPVEYIGMEVSDLDKKKILEYYNLSHQPLVYDFQDYNIMISEMMNLSNRIENDFRELFLDNDFAPDFKGMRKYIDYVSEMLDKAKKGEYDV